MRGTVLWIRRLYDGQRQCQRGSGRNWGGIEGDIVSLAEYIFGSFEIRDI
jgi:hypothetical protein